MAEKLFDLFRKERKRLELALAEAAARDCTDHSEIRRLKALHAAVGDQIVSWKRDLYGSEPPEMATAA